MMSRKKLSDFIRPRKKEGEDNHLIITSQNRLRVGDVMSKNVITISPDKDAFSAAGIMANNNISCLVILDNERVDGVITETDFLKSSAKHGDFDKIKVTEIKSKPVISISPEISIFEAGKIALDNRVKRLPVLKDKELVGIVTQTDMVRILTSYGMWWDVSDVMSSGVVGVQTDSTVAEAVEIMNSRNISYIAVFQDNQITGIFTEGDYLKKVITQQKDPDSIKIKEVMTSPVVSIPSICSVFSASRIMERMDIYNLPVMDNKLLYGIITQTEILNAVRNKLEAEKENNIHILIIDDNQLDIMALQRHLIRCDRYTIKTECAADLEQALEKFKCDHFDLVFLDNYLGDGLTARDVLEGFHNENIDIPVIIITGQGDQQTAVELMKIGAYDYIAKDKLAPKLLEEVIFSTAEQYKLRVMQKRSEELLRESEERYRRITNAVTDYIYTVRFKDNMPSETYHSNTCHAITGYTAEELTNDPYLWINMVHPEDQKAVLNQISDCMAGQKTEPLEHRIIRKDDAIRWLKSTLVPYLDPQGKLLSYDGLLRDVTDRRGIQEKLVRKQKNLEAIFDATPVGMLLVDENMIVRRVNKVLKQMVGKDYTEIINKRICDSINCINSASNRSGYGCNQVCGDCVIQKLVETSMDSQKSCPGVEIQLTLKVNGKEITPWLSVSAEPTDIDGSMYIVVAIDDITDRKEVAGELEQLNCQLQASVERANLLAQEAVVADLAKSQFLANMSHEIRTPMNAIMGFSELVAEEKLTKEQKHHITIIQESAKNLLQLLNDILDFSKIEAGKLNVDIVDCFLDQLFAVVESLMRPAAIEKGLNFEIRQQSQLPVKIRTDPVRLRQCLINLISNAIKFTPKGDVYVNISLDQIDDKSYLHFEVEDTGIGIAPDMQEMIFEVFTQADGGTSRKHGGAGLGLAITKQLTRLLGGQLSVSSKPGSGSVFLFVIPTNIDIRSQELFDKNDLARKLKHEVVQEEQSSFKGRVLVAEDSPTNQTLIRLILERKGLDVVLVEDGQGAVNKALNEKFDLIFMDIQMPNMTGYEATKRLRKKKITTPIVALTAHAMKGDRDKCLSVGCDDYLAKPINRGMLLKVIRKYLSAGEVKAETQENRIDSVECEVDYADQFHYDEQYDEDQTDSSGDTLNVAPVISWPCLVEACGDEETIEEVIKIFLEDAPGCFELLEAAIKTKNSKDIKFYAHRLKGSCRHVAAKQLAEMLYRLELVGEEGNVESVDSLFDSAKPEFERLISFLSKPDWIETAKQTT